MKTANEMYKYCTDNGLGTGMNKKWGVKHFVLVEQALMADEVVQMCFIGLHNYINNTQHNSNFAYAITNKRIIMAQQKVIGNTVQIVSLEHVNDITLSSGILFGVITIDTIKEKFNVALDKVSAGNIHKRIQEYLINSKNQPTAPVASVTDELRQFKGLLDDGIITQDEFDKKKHQLMYGA